MFPSLFPLGAVYELAMYRTPGSKALHNKMTGRLFTVLLCESLNLGWVWVAELSYWLLLVFSCSHITYMHVGGQLAFDRSLWIVIKSKVRGGSVVCRGPNSLQIFSTKVCVCVFVCLCDQASAFHLFIVFVPVYSLSSSKVRTVKGRQDRRRHHYSTQEKR